MSTLSSAITASASALSAERTRIEVGRVEHGQRRVHARARRAAVSPPRRAARGRPRASFDSALGNAGAVGVRVAAVVEDQAPFRRRYEPSHPDADAKGS